MHLDRTDDPRPAIRRQLADLVDDLERDVPGRVVLAALIDAARRLHLKLEGDPIRTSRGRRA